MRPLLSLGLFAALTVAATAPIAMAEALYAPQPFTLAASGHIVVPARINGRPVHMVLDTGAGATVLDTAAAKALGLALQQGAGVGVGAGGAGSQLHRTDGQRFEFAGTNAEDFVFRTMDLGHVVRALAAHGQGEVVGVIGVDWLKKHGATIDYATQTVTATR